MLSESQIKEGIEGNRKRNAELLSVLSKKGVKIDVARLVDYHFWAFEQQDAAMLGRELYREGYLILSISAVEQDGDKVWSVEAQMEHSPDVAASFKQTEKLTHLAAKFDSIYDGWGTRI